MSKFYSIKDGKCQEKDGNSTRTVGNKGAKFVSQGIFDDKDAYAILYDNGKVYLTIGNSTTEIRSGESSDIVSLVFSNNGIVFNHSDGKQYFKTKTSGKRL